MDVTQVIYFAEPKAVRLLLRLKTQFNRKHGGERTDTCTSGKREEQRLFHEKQRGNQTLMGDGWTAVRSKRNNPRQVSVMLREEQASLDSVGV